ncbi:MAG: hypothetical protein ACLUPL_08240 [Butyricimonas virosa]
MKRILYTLVVIFIGCIISCTPDKDEVLEMGLVDMDHIKDIKLRTSHYQLLANGKAQLEFNPLLTTKDGFTVQDSRIDHSQIEYYTSTGETLPKVFSTSDKSLIGEKINVHAKIKGVDLTSNTVTFTISDPSVSDTYTEITIPVIFHLIQSNQDIAGYGGEIPMERIHLLIDKINNTFSGNVSTNAMGVDTKIRFKAAVYDPYGNKLQEPGINRIYVEKVTDAAKDQYKTFIKDQKALWPYDKYLNVWLISDRENEYDKFFYTISRTCIPRYIATETDPAKIPEGLTLSSLPENWTPVPNEVGILYKLQSIQTMVRSFGEKNENELVNGFGYYLGLLPTWGASSSAKPQDYCSDTHKYYGNDNEGYNKKQTAYKLVGDCFFLAENIMDDPVGVHRSVSQQQAQRMRWILNNSPERSAWKSDYAFTGR